MGTEWTNESWLFNDDAYRRVRKLTVLTAKVLALGAITGMGTFVYLQQALAPTYVPRIGALALIVWGGILTPVASPDLRESITVSLFVVAIAGSIHVVAWTAPLYLLPYPPEFMSVLVPRYAGRAVLSAFVALPMGYFGGYFGGLFLFDLYVN